MTTRFPVGRPRALRLIEAVAGSDLLPAIQRMADLGLSAAQIASEVAGATGRPVSANHIRYWLAWAAARAREVDECTATR